MARLRGWRFEGLGADPSVGPSVTPSGSIGMVEGDAAIRQALAMLLSTAPGERVMRPDYGCPLHRLVFSPNDATTAGLAIHYVRQSVTRWEPRVEIMRLDAGQAAERDGDDTRLHIRLDYRVRSTRVQDRLALSIDLQGGGA